MVTTASIIGFGAAMIVFHLERELWIEEKDEERPEFEQERHWIPASDWLVV